MTVFEREKASATARKGKAAYQYRTQMGTAERWQKATRRTFRDRRRGLTPGPTLRVKGAQMYIVRAPVNEDGKWSLERPCEILGFYGSCTEFCDLLLLLEFFCTVPR
jgi:transposase